MTKNLALQYMTLIHDCITDAGVAGIPSGHLYAMLMERLSLEVYTGMVSAMKRAGKVKENNHVLTRV